MIIFDGLIATLTFGNLGNGALAVTTAEFMGVEAVHRALARQSLGQLGNDRVFCKFDQREEAPGAPNRGQYGFHNISARSRSCRQPGSGSELRAPNLDASMTSTRSASARPPIQT